MAPPQLPRYAPVADVVHPLVVNPDPVFRNEDDLAFVHHANRFFGQRLDLHEPLRRDQRLDDILGPFAAAQAHGVIFDFRDESELLEVRHHLLAGIEAVETGIAARFLRHAGILVNDFDLRQIVPLARFEVVGIVRGRDLYYASAEFRIGQLIENDRNLPIHQRQHDGLAVQIEIARVARVDGHRGVAQHGLRPRRRHHQVTVRADHRITNVPQVPLRLFVLDFEIGEHGLALWAPIHHVLATVDETLFPEPDEHLAHRARKSRVHGEALAAPVAAQAHANHLALDGVAVLLFPLPDARDEFFATDLAAARALLSELPHHHHLGRDAGMIRSRQPERVVPAHAMPADCAIDLAMLEHVSNVQRTGHVGWWNDQRKHRRGTFYVSVKDPGLDPPLRPMRLKPLRLIDFLKLHGEFSI